MSNMSVVSETVGNLPLKQRILSLQEQHSQLEEALAEQEARPMPDSLAIASLKRKKLAIKDELAALTDE
jgi:hypothetical protein